MRNTKAAGKNANAIQIPSHTCCPINLMKTADIRINHYQRSDW